MNTNGLTEEGLALLREVMVSHVDAGEMPGLVLLVSRNGDAHVDVIGVTAVGGS